MFRNCLLYFTIVSFPYLYNFVSSYKIDVTRSRWCNCLVRLQQWPCYLSARTWVRVPPTTSGFFFACNKVSPLNNRTSTRTSVPCAPINQLNAIRCACKTSKQQKKHNITYDTKTIYNNSQVTQYTGQSQHTCSTYISWPANLPQD